MSNHDDKFYDLSEAEIREVPLGDVYDHGDPQGRYLRVSYEGGEFPVYRVPLPEYLWSRNHIEAVRLLIEGDNQ